MIVVGWIVLSFVVAWAAGQKGRSSFGFFMLSLVLSPLIGLLVLIAVPSRVIGSPAAPGTATHEVPKAGTRWSIAPFLVVGGGLLVLLFVLAGREKSPTLVPTAVAPVAATTPAPPPVANNRPLTIEEVREAQTLLNEQGYNAGSVDGVTGPGTVAAAKRFEERRGWPATGSTDLQLLERLRANKPGGAPPTPSGPKTISATSADAVLAERVIRDADHPCPVLLAARRLSDASLRAACSNGEIYRIMQVGGRWLALRCSAAQSLGVEGC